MGMSTNKLRCIILGNSFIFRKWQASCILSLSDKADIVLLVMNNNPLPPGCLLNKIKSYPYRSLIYRLMMRFFIRFDSAQPSDMSDFFRFVPVMKCKTEFKGKFTEYFSDDDIQKIRSFKPDFILRFGFNIIKGEILDVAPYGVWSYHHSDEEKYRGGPPVFWEIFNNDPVTGAMLQRLTSRVDAGVVLKKGWFKTIMHSYKETYDAVLEESSSWVAGVCGEILRGNHELFAREPSGSQAKMNRYPDNIQALLFILKMIKNKILFHWQDLFMPEHWKIGIAERNAEEVILNGFPEKITWLESKNREKYFADPFIYDSGGYKVLMCENYSYKTSCAAIQEFGIENNGFIGVNDSVFDNGVHHSFPFTINYCGEILCLPESSISDKSVLYQFDQSGKAWNSLSVIMDEPLVDPVLFRYNGYWWLFCTRKDRNTCLNLFIYFAKEISGPYLPHQSNPVITDIRSARMAGGILESEGHLFRPAQDCSETNGGAIRFFKIKTLTESKYEEELIRVIHSPDKKFSRGMHTFSGIPGLTAIDVKMNKFSLYNFRRKFLNKFGIGNQS